MEIGLFYFSIYLVALGNGGYQPNIATFGSDQFEEDDPKEAHSKVTFFSYFYLALNIGSLFANTILCYFEDEGLWALGFWVSTGSAFLALVLFLGGTYRYRHFRPSGNPMSRIGQVVVAASRKWRVKMPPVGDDLYELDGKELAAAGGSRKILHTHGLKSVILTVLTKLMLYETKPSCSCLLLFYRFLDRAAMVRNEDFTMQEQSILRDPWRLCTITQVEEVKCVLRLLPIWLCTIIYSVVFTQMASLFVEQGAAMDSRIASFHIPAASMSAFDIIGVAVFIFLNRHLIHPLAARFRNDPRGLTELQRMGVGLIIAILAMAAAGIVEHFRLKQAYGNISTLSILWQVPQYVLIGASEVFMYVGQLEFFNDQAPDRLKSFGSALCMTSISLGNFASYLIVTAVMNITKTGSQFGWIPDNLNRGHMDRFFFLLGAMSAMDFAVYLFCAKWYQGIKVEGKCEGDALATGC